MLATVILYIVVAALAGAIVVAVFLAMPQGPSTLLGLAAVVTALAGLVGVLLPKK